MAHGFYFFGGCGAVLALFLCRWLREPVRGESESGATLGVAVHDAERRATLEPPEGETPTGWSRSQPLPVGNTLGTLFRTPTAILLMAAFLAANLVATVFLIWTPTFFVQKFHFSLTMAGLWGSVCLQLPSVVGAPAGGALADCLARRRPAGRILVQALGLSLGAPFVFLVGTTTQVGTVLAAMVMFGLCKGLYDANIFASLYDVVDPRAGRRQPES